MKNQKNKNAKFEVVLWDVDNTVLNFPSQEKFALKKCFSIFELGRFTSKMLGVYREICTDFGTRFPMGKLKRAMDLQNNLKFYSKNLILIFLLKYLMMNINCDWLIR